MAGFNFQDSLDSTLQDIGNRRTLAQTLMAAGGDGSPTLSPWTALNRAISPLVGSYLQHTANKQLSDLYDQAGPELAKMAASDNPVAFASMSNNHLIRSLAYPLEQQQIQQGIEARGAGAKVAAEGKARLGFEPQLAGATSDAENASALKYKPQIEAATATAGIAPAVQQETALMPLKERLLRLQQGPELQSQSETARHNKVMEGIAGGTAGGTGLYGQNPAALYGAQQ